MAKLVCNPHALGIGIGVVSALYMLVLSVAGLAGYWIAAVATMAEFHIFYSLTAFGIVAGAIEALVAGYVFGYLIAWFYNRNS